jgi:hypothetical protein
MKIFENQPPHLEVRRRKGTREYCESMRAGKLAGRRLYMTRGRQEFRSFPLPLIRRTEGKREENGGKKVSVGAYDLRSRLPCRGPHL